MRTPVMPFSLASQQARYRRREMASWTCKSFHKTCDLIDWMYHSTRDARRLARPLSLCVGSCSYAHRRYGAVYYTQTE